MLDPVSVKVPVPDLVRPPEPLTMALNIVEALLPPAVSVAVPRVTEPDPASEPTVSLLPPDDALFRALIVKFCADRQLTVDEAVVSYLATRIERSYAAVRQAVELLDSEALRLGRPITRALAAELLRNG